jgi:hypothetical protein
MKPVWTWDQDVPLRWLLIDEYTGSTDVTLGVCADIDGLFVDPEPPTAPDSYALLGCEPVGPLLEALRRPDEVEWPSEEPPDGTGFRLRGLDDEPLGTCLDATGVFQARPLPDARPVTLIGCHPEAPLRAGVIPRHYHGDGQRHQPLHT